MTSEPKPAKPVRDAAGNLGAWTAGAAASLAYVAITSRAFEPATIGAYASGVLAELLAYLAIGSGLTVAVQRRVDLSPSDEAAYVGRAMLAGLAAAAVLLIGSGPWGSLWDNPEATTFTRALAVVALTHPVSLVCIGILRRRDEHGKAAIVLAAAGVGSATLGAIPVIANGSPLTLVVSNALAPMILIGGCAAAGVGLRPRFDRRLEDGGFARASVILNLANYVAYNALAWSVSRFISVSTLGLYSRAWLMADLPAQGLASSTAQVLFPSFARDPLSRNRETANDALTLLSALAGIVLGLIGALSSLLVVVILGGNWLEAIPLLALLSLSLTAMPPHWLLASQLQALARFDCLARSRAMALAVAAIFVVLVAITGEPLIAAAGAGTVHAAAHAVDLRSAAKLQLLDAPATLRSYCLAALAASPLWAIAILQASGTWEPRDAGNLMLLVAATAAAGLAAAAMSLRLPAGRALRERVGLPAWLPGWLAPTEEARSR